ncbi:MAG: hypothetical protein LBP54_04225 [Campylobacteraceae bacterium]|nr:hypothetical protein [Campylobacteraceae bacterium]
MKLIVFCIILIAVVFLFRDRIVGTVVGDLKHLPPIVEKYNAKILSVEYFKLNGAEAIELQAICAQNSGWRHERMTRNFAQNCLNAEIVK